MTETEIKSINGRTICDQTAREAIENIGTNGALIVQEVGDSETAVMSQKAVSDIIAAITQNMQLSSESPNIFKPETYMHGYWGMNDDVYDVPASSSYYLCSAEYFPVKEGDVIRAYRLDEGVLQLRILGFITAYDATKTCMPSLSKRDIDTYTVPAGVSFVRFTVDSQHVEITINHEATEYEPYGASYYTATDDFIPQLGDIQTILDSIVEVE